MLAIVVISVYIKTHRSSRPVNRHHSDEYEEMESIAGRTAVNSEAPVDRRERLEGWVDNTTPQGVLSSNGSDHESQVPSWQRMGG